MRIPYAALRFSAEKKQTWDLTFLRNTKRSFKYSWNFIDSKIGTYTAKWVRGHRKYKNTNSTFLLPTPLLCKRQPTKHKGTLKVV
jgi:hypothetical protein